MTDIAKHQCNCTCGSCDSGAPHDPGCPVGNPPTSNLKPYWSHDYRSYDPGLNADGPPTKMYLAADVDAEIERLRASAPIDAAFHQQLIDTLVLISTNRAKWGDLAGVAAARGLCRPRTQETSPRLLACQHDLLKPDPTIIVDDDGQGGRCRACNRAWTLR